MGRSPTHGARALTTRLFSTRPPTRIEDRQRRALRAIQRGLTAQPIEHLHALTIGRLTRFELILQGYEAWLLANPTEPPPKHMLGIANAWRRSAELLAMLDQQLERADKAPDLQSYLAAREQQTAQAAPTNPGTASPVDVSSTSAHGAPVPATASVAHAGAPIIPSGSDEP